MGTVVETYTPDKKGYFRIGHVALTIPPEQIVTNQVTNSDELLALRTKYPQILKTGQARWDVTIHWKAMVTEDGRNYSQWEDLRTIVAIFKAAPFVEVENEHLRSVLSKEDKSTTYKRLAMGLRQLRVDTNPDLVDCLDVTLTMTLFNYQPYSVDFGYLDSSQQPGDATNSPSFAAYVDAWKKQNMDRPTQPAGRGMEVDDPDVWSAQTPGDTRFSWRRYRQFPGTEANFPPQVDEDSQSDWVFDHTAGRFTGPASNADPGGTFQSYSFWFTPKSFSLGDTPTPPSPNLYVTGLSVVFVNNLTQIPLSAYQYPTYQHIGPAGSMVGIAMQTAIGEGSDDDSPGLRQVTSMMRRLEDQFLELRTTFRSVTSVQRMQAFKVQNQVLNMLGIFSLQAKNLNSVTLEEQIGTQVQLLATQYENVYEEESSFKIQAIGSSYSTVLKDILHSSDLDHLTQEEKAATAPLLNLQQKMRAKDTDYLVGKILNDINAPGNAASYPFMPFPVPLTPQQEDALLAASDRVRANNPVLASIIDSHKGHITYADYFMLRNTAASQSVGNALFGGSFGGIRGTTLGLDPSLSGAIDKQLAAYVAAGHPDPVSSLYDAFFDKQMDPSNLAGFANTDKSFATSVGLLVNSTTSVDGKPSFADRFKRALAIEGPAGSVKGHGAYRDLGLQDNSLGLVDWNPGYYFKDYGADVRNGVFSDLKSKVNSLVDGLLAGGTILNKPQGEASVPTQVDQGISTNNPFGILQRSNFPATSMGSAFPTFKLFLIEEDNSTVFYAFDNFYSYSSVVSIEVIRYRDRPDAAMIQLTNLAGLLNHKLFDNSVEGKFEQSKDNSQAAAVSSDGEPITTPGGVAVKQGGSRAASGRIITPGFGDGASPVPLRYYGLQTGSKLQIRMGFNNNPDLLTPIFTGQITQIDEEEGMMTIMAQSYMLELMGEVSDGISTDGWSVLGSLSESLLAQQNAAALLLDGHPLDAVRRQWQSLSYHKSPAYGGWKIFGDDAHGDAGSIVQTLIKVPTAKHFGRWQVGQVRDPFLKGFTWKEQLGKLLPGAAGSLAQSGSDRSGENILVNQVIGADGTRIDLNPKLARSYSFERNYLAGASYHVMSGDVVSPWRIISDVTRRYPDFVLAVKQYGFPFQADATLVFASPNDWYYSRPPGLFDRLIVDEVKDSTFFWDWWTSGSGNANAATGTKGTNRQAFINVVNTYFDFSRSNFDFGFDQLFGRLGENQAAIIDGSRSVTQFVTMLDGFDAQASAQRSGLRGAINQLFSGAEPANRPGDPAAAQRAIAGIRNSLQNWLQLHRSNGKLGQTDASSRTQPVRRFHFVDNDLIIHNSIAINDKIYNVVKAGALTLEANRYIPDQYRRVLDADEFILHATENVTHQQHETQVGYCQSFLKEEVGKMYRGELVLRGIPEIEPFDIVLLTDHSTGMVGPIEVDSVVHSFEKDMGYITIVKPRAVVLVNEVATANFLAAIGITWGQRVALTKKVLGALSPDDLHAHINANIETGVGILSPFANGSPFLWMSEVLTAGALLASSGAFVTQNPILVLPLTRFGQPWIGGLNGYRLGDLVQFFGDKWQQFYTYELAPTIESYKSASKLLGGFGGTPLEPNPGQLGTQTTVPISSVGGPAVKAFALAIQKFEGYTAGSRSFRNNNPGNLRINGDLGRDSGGFARFSTYEQGLAALERDVAAKFAGHTSTGLGPNSTILQFFQKYAPATDNNNPIRYAQSVATQLGVTPSTTLGQLA